MIVFEFVEFMATTLTITNSSITATARGTMDASLIVGIVFGTVSILLILVLIGGAFWVLRHRRFGLTVLTEAEIRAFREGIPTSSIPTHSTVTLCTIDGDGHRNEVNLRNTLRATPYDARYEVFESEFAIDQSAVLGQGEFCIVRKALVRGTVVAAKTVLFSNKDNLKSLLTELKTMIHVNTGRQHTNIVALVGASTVKLNQGSCYVFLEFCEHGSLESYLRAHRSLDHRTSSTWSAQRVSVGTVIDTERNYLQWEKPNQENGGVLGFLNLAPQPPEIAQHFVRWCREIAAGMSYLAELQVIHGDLATRNVLLSVGLVAKVSDFGLSKRLYRHSKCVGSNEVVLPWRHLAPESLTQLVFSTYSDVWSFGITMWEIYTLGDVPFVGQQWTPEFADFIVKNAPCKPENSTDEMYEIMKKCWAFRPKERPSFRWLQSTLSSVSTDLSETAC